MLSRVANSLYWMSRYIERAENTARILDVNLQLLGNFEAHVNGDEGEFWSAIVATTGEADLFQTTHECADAENVTAFLTWEKDNPNSILTSVSLARENARMIRDQVSGEMWECINAMYYFVRDARSKLANEPVPFDLFSEVKTFSYRLVGLMEATYFQDEGYKFHQVGKFIERADQTSRILDLKYFLPSQGSRQSSSTVDLASWVAILRSCSAVDAFHRLSPAVEVDGVNVARFLILSRQFPRSIHYSVRHLDRHLRSISGAATGSSANSGEERVGELKNELTSLRISAILDEGLHDFINRLQQRLAAINHGIHEAYFELPPFDIKTEIAIQRGQQ